MPRKCPFHPKKWCGKSVTACVTCHYRMKVQSILTEEPPREETPAATVEILRRELTCPYCLYTDTVGKFTIRLKSGAPSQKRFKCPDCGEGMRRDTLFGEKSVEEFAEWLYDTQAWGRVSFNKFRQRLKDMGISYQFWNHYKKHKKEFAAESPDDYYMRQQQEAREEETVAFQRERKFALAILEAMEKDTGMAEQAKFVHRLHTSHLRMSISEAEKLITHLLREAVVFQPKIGYLKRIDANQQQIL